MLISPPFLIPHAANQQDDDWVTAAMPGGHPGDGSFPVSLNLAWHGGMHITAPLDHNNPLPVRAIADGTVVYVRQPTPPSTDPHNPLNYNGGWTSDGVVVVRHDTDIGTGNGAKIEFFSIYMHLSGIDRTIVANRPVYRKYPIGQAGQIYGAQQRKIHFEIILGDTMLRRLVNRSAGDVPLGANGRVDAVYGECYVRLPSGTHAYAAAPPADHAAPPGNAAPAYTTTEDLFVGLNYGSGNLSVTTYRANGDVVDAAVVEANAEYELYTTTGTLSEAYPVGHRPVRAAVLELLRFGRVIHADTTLNPAAMPHWRRIAYPGGHGYVNLDAAGTFKFSDADFPQWRSWSLVDDSANHDSRCDSATIRGWLDVNGDGHIEPAEATARLGDAAFVPRLSRAICKFATEWEEATINARWSWLMQATVENPHPMTQADFDAFRRHAAALSFWSQANLHSGPDSGNAVVPSVHWHIDPRELIKWARRCGWFSQDELARCMPRNELGAGIPWGLIHGRAGGNMNSAVNRFFQKYLGAARQRHVHALGQIFVETDHLATMSEYSGSSARYAPYYGRGLMQLTWQENYTAYGTYAGLAAGFDPNVVTQAQHAGESAGFYWVSKEFFRTSDLNRVCDLGLGGNDVGFVSWLVNGGGNGYQLRELYARYTRNVLLDDAPLSASETFSYPPVRALESTYPPSNPPATATVLVNYTQQIP